MSFNWQNFILLAEKLMQNHDEASLRTCISRSYYGVFCIARNKKGFKNYKYPDIHRKVIEEYMNSNKKEERQIGKILDDLRWWRNKADYDEDERIEHELAKRVLLKAKNILIKLEP